MLLRDEQVDLQQAIAMWERNLAHPAWEAVRQLAPERQRASATVLAGAERTN